MGNELLPLEALTISGGPMDALAAATRKGATKNDVYEGKDQFIAVILKSVSPTELTSAEKAVYLGISKPADPNDSHGAIHGFKIRIISANSPHAFLPEPCFEGGTDAINNIIKDMHTLALSRGGTYSPGDEVQVQLEKTDFSYNLDSCWIIGPVSSNQDKYKAGLSCLSAKDSFDGKSIVEFYKGIEDAGKVGGPSTATEINAAYPAVRAVPGFAEKIVEVANNVGIPDPGWLANLINFESGFDETKQNQQGSDCWGLIQFCRDSGASEVGVTWSAGKRPPDSFLNKGPIAQMDYVEKYFLKEKGKYKKIQDVYARVFFPISMGHGDEFNIYDWYLKNKPEFANTYRRQNPGITYKGDYMKFANKNAKLPTVLAPTAT